MKIPVRNSPERIEQMRNALIDAAQSYDDLTAITGLSKQAVATWVKAMRALKTVHVEGWALDARGRLFTNRFRWGNKPDARRAGPQRTAADRMRDMRARRAGAGKI